MKQLKSNHKQLKQEYEKLNAEYNSVSQTIKQFQNESYFLLDEIHDNENTITTSKQKLTELQALVEDLTTANEKNQAEYVHLQGEIEKFQRKQKSLEEILAQKKQQVDKIINKEICQRALSVNNKNSYRTIIKRNTNTTPIITEFCKNKQYEFLILNANMYLPNHKSFSYLIIRTNTTITEMKDNVPTMTEIKSVSGKTISGVSIPRMQFLKEHILEVARYNVVTQPRQIILLSEPCPIGGQSDINQTGYGNEYFYDLLVYEGTKYGEMTGFSVIGIQINQTYDW